MRLFKFLFISVIQLQLVNAQSAHSFLKILEQAESTNSTIRIELKDGYDFYEGKLLSKNLYLDNEEEDKTNLVVMKKSK